MLWLRYTDPTLSPFNPALHIFPVFVMPCINGLNSVLKCDYLHIKMLRADRHTQNLSYKIKCDLNVGR